MKIENEGVSYTIDIDAAIKAGVMRKNHLIQVGQWYRHIRSSVLFMLVHNGFSHVTLLDASSMGMYGTSTKVEKIGNIEGFEWARITGGHPEYFELVELVEIVVK